MDTPKIIQKFELEVLLICLIYMFKYIFVYIFKLRKRESLCLWLGYRVRLSDKRN